MAGALARRRGGAKQRTRLCPFLRRHALCCADVRVLRETGVTGYPYVRARAGGQPGALATPAGLRVEERRLLAMNAYLARPGACSGIGER